VEVGDERVRTLREDAGRAWFGARVDVGLPQSLVVTSEEEVLAARTELGAGNLVMKVLSDNVSHKSDVGGVGRCGDLSHYARMRAQPAA
jgi:acyl-CoA synthetase (NDP forming)